MGLMNKIASMTKRFWGSTLSSPARWFVDWLRDGTETDSGVTVNGKTALMYAPLWYAVNKISGHVGLLPTHLHEQKDERTAVTANKHPAYRLLKTRPNTLMTAIVFKQTLQAHAITWGNGRAAIMRNMRNDPSELIVLLPDRTITVLINGEKWHVTTDLSTGEKTKIHDRDVLHIPGLGFDGIQGYSVIEMMRNSIGLGLAAEKSSSFMFKNNGVPSLILEAPTGVLKTEEEARKFLKDWDSYHTGVSQQNKTGLLRQGIKANVLGMKGTDAQWIEQRRFQRQEAALWMQLEQILGDDSSVSYRSLEEKNKAYLTNCLLPWLTKWEQELDEKLLTGQQKRTASHFFKFQTAALLRGTTKDRYDVYGIAIANRIMNPNECRQLEDLPPYEGGDEYINPHTTPGEPAGTGQPTDDEPSDDDQPTTREPDGRVKSLIASRLREIIGVEAKRVCEAAVKQKNFCGWVDEFYSELGFLPRLRAIWQQCGGTAEQADSYAGESKAALVDLAGTVATNQELAAAVSALTSAWDSRADVQSTMIVDLKPQA